MTIHTLRALKDNFIYVLATGRECAVIDPGDAGPVEEFLAQLELKLTHILCTHHHHDHIDGVPALAAKHGCGVLCSHTDRPRIAGATQGLGAGEKFQLLGELVEVMEIPGHTHGQIAYHLPRLAAVFPGDTLFSCGCGRLFEGTPAQMFASMCQLRALPSATQVYFGHEYSVRNAEFVMANLPSEKVRAHLESCAATVARGGDTTPTTIGVEMEINPLLNAASAEDFKHWRELRNSW